MIFLKRLFNYTFLLITAIAAIYLLYPLVNSSAAWPTQQRDYFEYNAVSDTGAANTVSAIYLGYRLFDTMGETLVLLVSVSAVVWVIGGKKDAKVKSPALLRSQARRSSRTTLIEVAASKLAPVVFLFGIYLMMYGHLSPGGGFQGGVVIASGIVFLVLGSPGKGSRFLGSKDVLMKTEAGMFLVFSLAGILGEVFTGQFFGNIPAAWGLNPVSFIVILNTIIGLKVAGGISVICIEMLKGLEQ